MAEKIAAFQCDYCTRISRTVTGIKLHEQACKNNVEVQACTTCGNFRLVDYNFSCHEEESPFWDDDSMSYDELMKDPNIYHVGGFQKYCQSWVGRSKNYGDGAECMTNLKNWIYPVASFHTKKQDDIQPFDSDDEVPF